MASPLRSSSPSSSFEEWPNIVHVEYQRSQPIDYNPSESYVWQQALTIPSIESKVFKVGRSILEKNDYKCPIQHCKIVFPNAKDLRTHLRLIHHFAYDDFPKQGEALNLCPIDQCRSKFRKKVDLKNHLIRKHHAQQEFLASQGLLTIPKNQKKFPCPIPTCPSGFGRKNDFNRHMRRKHSELTQKTSTL